MTTQELDPLFPGQTFISTVLGTLDTKERMRADMLRRYLQRAAMAGVLIGVMYVTNYSLVATFTAIPVGDTTLAGIGTIAGAMIFGWALVFIYYTKSELLTSNMMIVSIGAYYRRMGSVKALRLLFYCYVGNILGGLFIAVLLAFSTLLDGGVMDAMSSSVDHKLEYVTEGISGWADLLVRAILCNFMINLAMLVVYNGLIKSDVMKSAVMLAAVFVFVFLGLEHSVANTVLFEIVGLQEGIDIGPALGNLGLALLGNFIGGGILIGLYYAYVNDKARHLRKTSGAG
jgi:formate/nitrite transporter FocA (FNT family)